MNGASRLLRLRTHLALAGLLLAAYACAPLTASSTPVPVRAVYLVEGQAVLSAADLQAHPQIWWSTPSPSWRHTREARLPFGSTRAQYQWLNHNVTG
jgi:hypothetical protein